MLSGVTMTCIIVVVRGRSKRIVVVVGRPGTNTAKLIFCNTTAVKLGYILMHDFSLYLQLCTINL